MKRALFLTLMALFPGASFSTENCKDTLAQFDMRQFQTYSELKAHLDAMKAIDSLQDLQFSWEPLPKTPHPLTGPEMQKEISNLLNAAAPEGNDGFGRPCSVEFAPSSSFGERFTEVVFKVNGKKHQDSSNTVLIGKNSEYYLFKQESKKVFDFELKKEFPGLSAEILRYEEYSQPNVFGMFLTITTSKNFPGNLVIEVGNLSCSFKAPLY